MAILAKKHRYKKNNVEQTANIYSTVAEAGSECISNKVDGVTGYVAIGSTTDGRATAGRVTKGGTKAVLTTGKPPYNKVEYRTPGTYTITLPAGVDTVRTTVAGAGGGGAGGNWYNGGGDDPDWTTTGRNGGRGGLVISTISVTGTIEIIVGAGGAGAYTQAGSGGSSEVTGFVKALGGGGAFSDKTTGASYGEGGIGGYGNIYGRSGGNGANGWVIIEYGGDI